MRLVTFPCALYLFLLVNVTRTAEINTFTKNSYGAKERNTEEFLTPDNPFNLNVNQLSGCPSEVKVVPPFDTTN